MEKKLMKFIAGCLLLTVGISSFILSVIIDGYFSVLCYAVQLHNPMFGLEKAQKIANVGVYFFIGVATIGLIMLVANWTSKK